MMEVKVDPGMPAWLELFFAAIMLFNDFMAE